MEKTSVEKIDGNIVKGFEKVNTILEEINNKADSLSSGIQGSLELNSSKPVNKGQYVLVTEGEYVNIKNKEGETIKITEEDLRNNIIYAIYNGEYFTINKVPINIGRGENNGVAPLNEDKKIPQENLTFGEIKKWDTNVVSGSSVFNEFKKIGVNLGYKENKTNVNIAPELVSPNFSNSEIWRVGIFLQDGSVNSASGWYSTKNYTPIYEGSFKTNLYFAGNACMVVYGSDKEVLRTIGSKGSQNGTLEWEGVFSENEKFVRFSRREANAFDSYIKQDVNEVEEEVFTDKVFYLTKNIPVFKNEISTEIDHKLNNFDLKTIEIGFNFLSELTNSSYNDTDVWVINAFLQADGSVSTNQTAFRYTREYWLINESLRGKKIRFRNRYNGNAKCLVYNKDKSIVQVLENSTSTWLQDVEVLLHTDAYYIRLSIREDYVNQILLANTEAIYKNEAKINISNSVLLDDKEAVSSDAVANKLITIEKLKSVERPNHKIVTFVSDDGRAGNLSWFLPMMEENNCRATLAIVGSWMNGGMGFQTMTRDEIWQCHLKGHDIASHTNTHPRLATIDISEVDTELYKAKFALAEIGIDAKMFVAPFGNRNTEVDKVLRKYYDTDFITVNDNTIASKTCTNLPNIDRFNLKRISFDASNNNDSRLEICKQAVDVLEEVGGWLVFTIHPHYPEYLQSGNPDGYEARRQELQDLITYIRSKEINILPANLAYDYYKNQTQIGDVRLTDKSLVIGSNGSIYDSVFVK